jgi:hypothetical protein
MRTRVLLVALQVLLVALAGFAINLVIDEVFTSVTLLSIALAAAVASTFTVNIIHDTQLRRFVDLVKDNPADMQLSNELVDKLLTLPAREMAVALARLEGLPSPRRRDYYLRMLESRETPLAARVDAQVRSAVTPRPD